MSQEKYNKVFPFGHVPILYPALFYDDCEGNYSWITTGTGTDYAANYATQNVFVGKQVISLKTRATTPTINDTITIQKTFGAVPTQLVRIQLLYRRASQPPTHSFELRFDWYDGENLWCVNIRLDGASEHVDYWRADHLFHTIPNWRFDPSWYTWNRIDLSVDLLKHLYRRLAINHQVTDLNAEIELSEPDTKPAALALSLNLRTLENIQAWALVDQVLVTPESL